MKEIIEGFKNKHIVVVGDIILDKYIYGDVSRINPEAPVPVLNVKKVKYVLGGATNVAANITSLGGRCTIMGQVGKDDAGAKVKELLKEQDIDFNLIENENFMTIKKTRIVAKNQHVVRVDWEIPKEIEEEHVGNVIKSIKASGCDMIIVSDYAKGTVTKELMDGLKTSDTKIIVDPKPKNKELYKGVFLITPNTQESREMTGTKDIEKMGKELVKQLGCNVILTRSEEGVSVFSGEKHHYIPAKAREVYDVTGAGDTFVAAISLAISSGASLSEAALVANHASGISVSKLGTATVTTNELLSNFEMENRKIKTMAEMKKVLDDLRLKKKKMVFTNGCFDILHVGHISLLRQARSFGDALIVGLNTDSSIKKLKGSERPINNQEERAEVLSSLGVVDYIVFFGEDDPCNIISELKPDIHVKGGDYDPSDYKNMPEAKVVHDYGGEVKIVDIIDNKSTTNIINRIKE